MTPGEFVSTGVGELTGWGAFIVVCMAVVFGFIRGFIRTAREVDAAELRADKWQQAWDTSEAARKLQAEQLGELLEISRTNAQFFRSLQAGRTGGEG